MGVSFVLKLILISFHPICVLSIFSFMAFCDDIMLLTDPFSNPNPLDIPPSSPNSNSNCIPKHIPKIGGRYSVLSEVGIVPAYLIGINILKLRSKLVFFEEKTSDNNFIKNFACSVQKVYEHFFKKIISQILSKKYSNKIVFSGGCALNSSANKILTENKNYFEDIYINYAPGDNGGAIGAALVVATKYFNEIQNLKTPYLGSEYNDNEVKKILESDFFKSKFSYKFYENDNEFFKSVAKLIAEGSVIGWFQGKMEFGPRALGNRSILADPSNPKMKEIINSKIKRRESFRPFAPVVLKKFQQEWFESDFHNLYMSSVTKVKKNKQSLVPAITHVDETSRIQSVDEFSNKKLTFLITEFEKYKKIPLLLNTSFNENEPIVESPEQAIECFLRTNMDILVLGGWVISRK